MREFTLTENLEVSILCDINDGDLTSGELAREDAIAIGFIEETPEVVDVDDGAEVVIAVHVVVAHTNLTEVTRMVLVEVDSVVVETSSVTTSTRMLAVLSNTTVTG